MGAKFSLGQKVKLISVVDENDNKKYPQFEQYLGKVGIIADVSNFPYGPIIEKPPSHYIYTLRFGDREVSGVPEECLISVE